MKLLFLGWPAASWKQFLRSDEARDLCSSESQRHKLPLQACASPSHGALSKYHGQATQQTAEVDFGKFHCSALLIKI